MEMRRAFEKQRKANRSSFQEYRGMCRYLVNVARCAIVGRSTSRKTWGTGRRRRTARCIAT